MARDFFVVIPDDGDIFGNTHPGLLQRLVTANRGAVVLAENGSGSVVQRQQFLRCGIARACRPVALDHQLRIERDIGRRQSAPIALEPVLRGFHPWFASNSADAPMAMLDQMTGRMLTARDLAWYDSRKGMVRRVAVDENDRNVEFVNRRRQDHLARKDRHIDQCRNSLLAQGADRAGLHLGVVERLGDQDDVAGIPRGLACAFDSDDCFRTGRKLVDDKADLAVDRRRQDIRGVEMGEARCGIAERTRRLYHPFACFGGKLDARCLVEHEGDGGLRAPCNPGDVGHCHTLADAFAPHCQARGLNFASGRIIHRITHPERRFQRPEDWPESMKLWGILRTVCPTNQHK